MVDASAAAVIAGPLIIAGIILYTYLKSNAEDIKANWVQYRCNPIYMPFAGMFGADVFLNFQFCIGSIASSFFGYALGPVYSMFGLFAKMIKDILAQMNKFRAFVVGMMTFITSFFTETIGRLSNTFGTLIHLLSIVRNLSNRILASAAYTTIIMSTGVNLLLSTFSFVWSLLKTLVGLIIALSIILLFVFPPLLFFFIPIGIAIGVSTDAGGCFHPDTPVQMASGQYVAISTIKVGDVLSNNAVVTGTMRFTATDPLYMYRSVVCVSGSHIVCDSDGVWRKVEDSMNSVPYTGPPLDEIVCLRTSNNRIHIRGCIFADYDEVKHMGASMPLKGTDTIRRMSDNAKVELQNCYPGLETTCGVLRCVMQLENNTYQVIVNNPTGKLYINDSMWVSDYLGEEHDPDVYNACHKKAMEELNRMILNNVRHQG
jgi:hypothetical protein